MKYRALNLPFTIEDVSFQTLSICLEKLDMRLPMHSHSKNSYEIHYISYGYGKLNLKDASYEITPGTLFVTGPKVEHEQISVPEDPMTEYCIYLKVDSGKHSPKSVVNTFLSQDFWFGSGDSIYHELMKQIILELENREVGHELVLQALLQQVVLYLTRKYNVAGQNSDSPSSTGTGVNDLTYLIIEEAFLYNYRDITLESLAAQVKLGPRQTERLLRLHYNKTFQQKKTEARMSAACSLLRDTISPVSDIALNLGYSSVEHFSNAFKKHIGCTATEYRARHAIGQDQ